MPLPHTARELEIAKNPVTRMEKNMSPLNRAEVDERLAQALADDPGLREQLEADPRSVLSSITGISIPDFVEVTVHQESLTDIHLVLNSPIQVLSEEDLQLVSGGWNPNGRTSHCGTDSCGS